MTAMITVAMVAISCLGAAQAMLLWRKTKNKLHLLQVPVNVMGALAFGFLYVALENSFSVSVGTKFYLLLVLVFPPLILWAEEFTRRMKRIASTGQFELGLPVPSDSYQLLGTMGQIIQELAKPIVAVQGPTKMNLTIDELAKTDVVFRYVHESPEGRFEVDPGIIPIFKPTESIRNGFISLTDFLVRESALLAGRLPREDFEGLLRKRVGTIVDRHSDMLIRFGLLDRLAGGIFSTNISSGLTDFDIASQGGYPKSSAILLCGPPSNERNLLLDSFIGTGLARGDSCICVTSAQPPENVKHQFGDLSKGLTIVDCYTNRIREVPTISVNGNVITTPVEISVVAVAISRALNRETDKVKRAVLDILPTYLVFQKMEKLYLDLMEIIDDLRKAGYTAIFSLNPYYIKDEGAVSTLQELFDGVIHVERTADVSGITGEITIRIEKMGRQGVPKPTFKIGKPGQLGWQRPQQPTEISTYAREPPAVEA